MAIAERRSETVVFNGLLVAVFDLTNFCHTISIQIGEFSQPNLCAKIQLKSSASAFIRRLTLGMGMGGAPRPEN